ncbi:MAG: WD40 repeat domain-containing protein, partial [Pseudonocardiaceae bacterium]
MLDREHGQTVYRFAHRTFAEHFTVEADPDSEVKPNDRRRHHAIVLHLIADADPAAQLNPYVTHYLSAHIGAAGEQAWLHLADRPGLLDRLDPNSVGADAMRTAFSRFPLPPEIAGVIGSRHLLAGAMPGDRAGLRQLAMTRHTGIRHPGISGGADGSTWTVSWASMPRQPTHLTLTGHTGAVAALTAVPGAHGRMLLATGSYDGTVRLWDPITGARVGDPLTGHTGQVRALAAVSGPLGRMLLATCGSYDGTVQLWDPITGARIGDPLTGTAVLGPDGRTVLVTGSYDGTVQLWDSATGTPVGDLLSGHTRGVTALAAVPGPDGRMLLASASEDGTVRL